VKEKSILKIFLLFILVFIFLLQSAEAERVYLDFTSPVIKRIPTAILLSTPSTEEGKLRISEKIFNILSNDLIFSGVFDIIKPSDYPSQSVDTPVDYQAFRAIGAEVLITCSWKVSGKTLITEFRHFDTIEQRQRNGKRYRGSIDQLRKMVHKFANIVYESYTGEKGIFETKIVFVSAISGTKEIYIMDFDGHNVKRLTWNRSINLSPSWSPDGGKVLFTSYVNRNPDLYCLDLSTGLKRRISARLGLNAGAVWSPDGKKIALMMRKGGGSKIFLINSDGSNPIPLTSGYSNDASPTWSPDGKKIAFVSNRSGSPQIYIMNSDGTNLRRLTYEGKYNASPAWSPKGDKIAFARMENGRFNIFTISPTGENERRLTENSGNNEDPSWAPNGRFIAFSSNRDGVSEIYVMNANGSNQRKITFFKGGETSPSWSPFLSDN